MLQRTSRKWNAPACPPEEVDATKPIRTRGRRGRRSRKSSTTFTLYWEYEETAPRNPQCNPGVVTLICSPGTHHAYTTALRLLRHNGLTIHIRDDDAEDSASEDDARDIQIYTCQDWVYMRCANHEVSSLVQELLCEDFGFGIVEHKETIIQLGGAISLKSCTGNRKGDIYGDIGVLFELRKGKSVIGKARCSYLNGEMDSPGPSIEMFEIAKEWKGQGYGTLLLDEITCRFMTEFDAFDCKDNVRFHVSNVTHPSSRKWFLDRDFAVDDHIGEELSQLLW